MRFKRNNSKIVAVKAQAIPSTWNVFNIYVEAIHKFC